jgi:hypothetical protein
MYSKVGLYTNQWNGHVSTGEVLLCKVMRSCTPGRLTCSATLLIVCLCEQFPAQFLEAVVKIFSTGQRPSQLDFRLSDTCQTLKLAVNRMHASA